MTTVFKSEIEWRSDVAAAPRDKPILMIATSMVPNQANDTPDMVVAHWYYGSEWWVAANVYGDPRPGARLPLKPIYWAELGNLPPGVSLRGLMIEDFRG